RNRNSADSRNLTVRQLQVSCFSWIDIRLPRIASLDIDDPKPRFLAAEQLPVWRPRGDDRIALALDLQRRLLRRFVIKPRRGRNQRLIRIRPILQRTVDVAGISDR